MRYSILKISILFIGLVILFFWSFSFQEQKKVNKFKNQLNEARVYNDPLIDEIYIDFLTISNFDITDQDVSIQLVEFPFVFDWMSMYKEETNLDMLNDLMGIALGMWEDNKINIYLNYNDWRKLSLKNKRKLIYHELLHDCYNLEHVENSCDIMSAKINSCSNFDLDKNLYEIINNE